MGGIINCFSLERKKKMAFWLLFHDKELRFLILVFPEKEKKSGILISDVAFPRKRKTKLPF